jgi:hypothetical protein
MQGYKKKVMDMDGKDWERNKEYTYARMRVRANRR